MNVTVKTGCLSRDVHPSTSRGSQILQYSHNLFVSLSVKQFFIGFQILFSDTPIFTEAELVYTNMDTTNSLPEVVYIPIDNRVTRYVWVFIAGDLNRLHMREFNVFGGIRSNFTFVHVWKQVTCSFNAYFHQCLTIHVRKNPTEYLYRTNEFVN